MPTHGERDSAQFRMTWTNAMMKLRLGFTMHGYDMSGYRDDAVHAAIVPDAIADIHSSRDDDAQPSGNLFARAFERLENGTATNPAENSPRNLGRMGSRFER